MFEKKLFILHHRHKHMHKQNLNTHNNPYICRVSMMQTDLPSTKHRFDIGWKRKNNNKPLNEDDNKIERALSEKKLAIATHSISRSKSRHEARIRLNIKTAKKKYQNINIHFLCFFHTVRESARVLLPPNFSRFDTWTWMIRAKAKKCVYISLSIVGCDDGCQDYLSLCIGECVCVRVFL